MGEDQVGGDRRDLIKPRLAELALDVVILGEAEAAVGLDACAAYQDASDASSLAMLASVPQGSPARTVPPPFHHHARLPRPDQERAIGNCTPWFWPIGRPKTSRVLAYRPPIDEEAAVADAFCRNQNALGVHAVEDVAEALALFADEVLGRHRQIVEEQLGRRVIEHGANRPDGQAVPDRLAQVDQQHATGRRSLLRLLARRGAAEQQHQIGMFGAADPDLLAVDDVAVALAPGEGADRVVSVPLVGSVTPKACSRRSPDAIFGRNLRLLLGAAVPQHRAHRVHLRVAGGAVAARAMDLLEDRRRGAEAKPEPPYSSGIRTERKPASVRRSTNAVG